MSVYPFNQRLVTSGFMFINIFLMYLLMCYFMCYFMCLLYRRCHRILLLVNLTCFLHDFL